MNCGDDQHAKLAHLPLQNVGPRNSFSKCAIRFVKVQIQIFHYIFCYVLYNVYPIAIVVVELTVFV